MTLSAISAFDSMASEYDSWFKNKGKLVFAIEIRALEQVLPPLPKPWLEIGVGSGRFAQALGIETGLDPSPELLKIAKSRGINTLLSKGEKAPFKNHVFGAVFITVTLCFVDSPLKVLMEANRLLKKGGNLVLGSVLAGSPWGELYDWKKEAGHRFYKYATFYSYAELEALLVQAGFSIEKVISTLFQRPDKVDHIEFPQEGFFSDAGFTVIVAGKAKQRSNIEKGADGKCLP